MIKTEFFFKSRKIRIQFFLDFLDHRFYIYYFDIIIYLSLYIIIYNLFLNHEAEILRCLINELIDNAFSKLYLTISIFVIIAT